MKYFLFLFAILFIGLSFKPTNQSRNFDFHFVKDDISLTEKSNQQLSDVAKYAQQFETFNLSIEVPPNNDEELNRDRLDKLLFELENLDLSVERILFYSSKDHLPDNLKDLANRNSIRLTVDEIISDEIIVSRTEQPTKETITLDSKKSTEIKIQKWAKPVVNYQKNVKRFTINNYAKSSLKTADGSFIEIEPESFVFEDGSIVSTPITVETKYANTKNISILDELTTTFENGILESRGMMYVNATANGKQLKLVKGKAIEINIKTKTFENSFQAFQGRRNLSNGQMDWLLDDNETKLKDYDKKYKYYKYEKISAEKQAGFIKFRDEQIQSWEDRGYTKKQIKTRLKSAELSIRKREKYKMDYYKKRSFHTNNYEKETLRKKDYDLIRKNEKNNPNRYSTEHKIGVPEYEFIEYEKKKNPKITNTFYVASSMSLGWCNIDRLLKLNEDKPPCDLIVKAGEDENIKIVFDEYFVVLKGMPHKDGFIFKNVPQGVGITVLSATKLDDGSIKFAKTKTELSNKTINLSDYSTISSDDFITFIEKLTV